MNQRIWTSEEDEYIKSNFGNKPFSEMAKHLNCAITIVQNRAKTLGFEVEKKTARRWTEEEIKLLKIMAPKYLNKTIARKLNRSINELNKKARELGIKLIVKRPVWKKWKIKFLKENINILSLSQIGKELEVNYYQIMDKLDELGIEYNNNFWSEEEINILTELADKVYIRELAKTTKLSELVKELNRTSSSIKSMAKKLEINIISDRKNWTEEEYNLLEKLTMIDKKTPKEIADIFGRSEDAIIIKINRRGLQIQTNDKRFWTKEEETLLSDLWGTESFENIAKKLNRTVSSIKNKAFLLGLGSVIENNYNGLTIKDISDLLGININTVSVGW